MYQLDLKVEGPIFEEGIPLHMALDTLENVKAIVDKTYLAFTGKRRVTQRDRDIFHLKTTEFRRGSLEAVFDLFIEEKTPLESPSIVSLSADKLWKSTKEAFNFLELVFSAARSGKKPTFVINIQGDVTVTIDGKTHTYDYNTYELAKGVLPHYQNLAHQMADGGIEKITFGKRGQKDIFLTSENHDLFDIPRKIDDEEKYLECDIFRFNKYTYTGNIKVINGSEHISEGKYSFGLSGHPEQKKEIADYITAMLHANVILTSKIEKWINPLYQDKDEVEKVHVYDVKPKPAASV